MVGIDISGIAEFPLDEAKCVFCGRIFLFFAPFSSWLLDTTSRPSSPPRRNSGLP